MNDMTGCVVKFLKSVRKSVNDVKENIMTLFPRYYKPKKTACAFDDNVKYKIEGDEQLTMEQDLKILNLKILNHIYMV